jgi:hypothetical protein
MSAQPSSPVVPHVQEVVSAIVGDVVVAVGWRVERDIAELRAVRYLVRGQPDWLEPDVRYAVPLAPIWCRA